MINQLGITMYEIVYSCDTESVRYSVVDHGYYESYPKDVIGMNIL